jgi:hypothetical protein
MATAYSFKDWKPGPQGQVRDHWLCLDKQKGSKSEARNPKQYRMSKIQIIQTIGVSGIAITDLFLSLHI